MHIRHKFVLSIYHDMPSPECYSSISDYHELIYNEVPPFSDVRHSSCFICKYISYIYFCILVIMVFCFPLSALIWSYRSDAESSDMLSIDINYIDINLLHLFVNTYLYHTSIYIISLKIHGVCTYLYLYICIYTLPYIYLSKRLVLGCLVCHLGIKYQ
jgi:hypothetical protein